MLGVAKGDSQNQGGCVDMTLKAGGCVAEVIGN